MSKSSKTKSAKRVRPTIKAVVGTPFRREARYLIFKISDTRGSLTEAEAEILSVIALKVAQYREVTGRQPLDAVVVERDWPEYEPVWKMIEERMACSSNHGADGGRKDGSS